MRSKKIELPVRNCKEKIIQLFDQNSDFYILEESESQIEFLIENFYKNLYIHPALIPAKRTGIISFEGNGETTIYIKMITSMYKTLQILIPIFLLLMSIAFFIIGIEHTTHRIIDLMAGFVLILIAIGLALLFNFGINYEEKLVEDLIHNYLII